MNTIEVLDEDFNLTTQVFWRLGCDPELFLTKNGEPIESCEVICKNGFVSNDHAPTGYGAEIQDDTKIVRDGFQIELNPKPYTCRAYLAREIRYALTNFNNEVLQKNGVQLAFIPAIKLKEEQMKNLSDESLVFGCKPSFNVYTGKESVITVKADKYPVRTAGGHIHVGFTPNKKTEHMRFFKNNYDLLATTYDLLVGNICVILDRDPNQVERRKVYGRAGEIRKPKYGIEYRTLSSFWLRAYPLYSLVMGLMRFATNYCYQIYLFEEKNKERKSLLRKLYTLVDKKDVETAINLNDRDLAWKNWSKIKGFLLKVIPATSDSYCFNSINVPAFEYFMKKGLNFWFKEDPLTHWINLNKDHGTGWESFLSDTVIPAWAKAVNTHLNKKVKKSPQ